MVQLRGTGWIHDCNGIKTLSAVLSPPRATRAGIRALPKDDAQLAESLVGALVWSEGVPRNPPLAIIGTTQFPLPRHPGAIRKLDNLASLRTAPVSGNAVGH
jgi:hypothetical protein